MTKTRYSYHFGAFMPAYWMSAGLIHGARLCLDAYSIIDYVPTTELDLNYLLDCIIPLTVNFAFRVDPGEEL